MAVDKTINLNVNTKGAQKNVNDLEKAVEGVNNEVKDTGASTAAMGNTVDKATGGAVSKFKAFKGGLTSVIASFKSLRVAILATGIGALLIAVTSLGQAFTRSEEGQNKFAKILGVIGSVTDNLLDLLADLGENIISVFENPKQAITDFANLIKDNIVNRFEGLLELIPNLGKSISLLFKGEFKAAGKLAADAMGKVVLGVDSVTDSVDGAIEAVKEFGKEVADDAANAAKIADQRAKAEKMARDLIVERAEAERRIAEIREKAADKENFTAAERIELIKEAGKISEDLANKEAQVAKERLQAIELENSLAKSNKQALDEEANARAQVIQLETNRLRLQKALTAEVTTAIRENNAEQKALADQKAAEDKEREDKAALEKKERDKKALEEQKLLNQQIAEAQQNLEQAKANAIRGGLQVIGMLAGKSKSVAKTLLVVEKGLAIAQVISNAAKAIAAAKANLAATPAVIGVVPNPAYVIQAAATAKGILSTKLTAATSIATIAAQAVAGLGGGGGGGASVGGLGGGAAAQPQAPSFNIVGATETSQLAQAVGGQTQQPVQAYVVANDVTTAQSLENNIVEGATIGS